MYLTEIKCEHLNWNSNINLSFDVGD